MSWRWFDPLRFPGDQNAVLELHHKMELRLGREMDLPDLGREPVIASIVKENERGEITNAIFLEAQVEACAIGEEPLTPAEAREAIREFLMPAVERYKLRIVRVVVPAEVMPGKRAGKLGPIPRLLKRLGFTQDNGTVVHFYRWLVPAAEPTSGKDNGNG